MSILVISHEADFHTAAVRWGLRQYGLESVLWQWSNFPASDSSSLCYSGSIEEPIFSLSSQGPRTAGPFDVIWSRRGTKPRASKNADPADHNFIAREADRYVASALTWVGHDRTFWVNAWEPQQRADQKMNQLYVARQVGFTIPDTLMSNDFVRIRDFFLTHNKRIIYKPFLGGAWPDDERTAVTGTSLLVDEHFETISAFTHCPGIYQPYFEKAFELRITVMGLDVYAIKIDSQVKGAVIDWRPDMTLRGLPIQSFELPEAVIRRCQMLMQSLGLAFGCIDMIVTPTGEYIFLEVNIMGQFLWIEGLLPEAGYLDAFCNYLAQRDPAYIPSTPTLQRVSLHRYIASDEYATWEKNFSRRPV